MCKKEIREQDGHETRDKGEGLESSRGGKAGKSGSGREREGSAGNWVG